MRLRLPASYAIAPHWNATGEHVTVLTGALSMGLGDILDRDAANGLY